MRTKVNVKLISIFVIIVCSCGTTVRMNSNYKNVLRDYNNFTEMPCNSEITFIKFNGQNEKLYDDEKIFSEKLERVISEELTNYGLRYVPHQNLLPDSLNEEQRYNLSIIHDNFDKALMELYQKPFMNKRDAYNINVTLGHDVNYFADIYKTDLLVFSKLNGFINSPGENAKNVGKSIIIGVLTLGQSVPIYYSEGGVVYIAMVDGNTGNILWANYVDLSGSLNENNLTYKIKGLILRTLKSQNFK